MTERTPQDGGRARGGPHSGRILAYGGPLMPVFHDGRRIGCYIWVDNSWIWEDESEQDHDTEQA